MLKSCPCLFSIIIVPSDVLSEIQRDGTANPQDKRFSMGNITQPSLTQTYRTVAPYETKDLKNRPFKVDVNETLDVLIKDQKGMSVHACPLPLQSLGSVHSIKSNGSLRLKQATHLSSDFLLCHSVCHGHHRQWQPFSSQTVFNLLMAKPGYKKQRRRDKPFFEIHEQNA